MCISAKHLSEKLPSLQTESTIYVVFNYSDFFSLEKQKKNLSLCCSSSVVMFFFSFAFVDVVKVFIYSICVVCVYERERENACVCMFYASEGIKFISSALSSLDRK